MKFRLKALAAVLLAAVLMSVSAASASAVPAATISSEAFAYVIAEDGVVLTKYTGSAPEVAIPEKMGDLPVVALGEGLFAGHDEIITVIIPEGVISIHNKAFEGCTALLSVSLPSSIESVGEAAFSGCSALLFADLCEGVKSIGARAFEGCGSLGAIFLPASLIEVGETALSGCDALRTVVVGSKETEFAADSLGTIRDSLTVAAPEGASVRGLTGYKFVSLSGAEALEFSSVAGGVTVSGVKGAPEAVLIPDSVEGKTVVSISSAAFSRCPELIAAILPNTIKNIDVKAFSGAAALGFVRLPSYMQAPLYDGIFDGCAALFSINIPDGIMRIEDNCFRGCAALDAVILPSSFYRFGSGVFVGCTSLKNITLLGAPPAFSSQNGTDEMTAFGGVPAEMKVLVFSRGGWEGDKWWPNGSASFGKTGYDMKIVEHQCFCHETVIIPVGCAGEGRSRFDCAFCEESFERTYPRAEHAFVSFGTSDDGVETFRCSNCQENYLRYHLSFSHVDVKIDRASGGAEVFGECIVKFKDRVLVEGIDYTVERSYEETGRRAKLKIEGIGEYVGNYYLAYDIATGRLRRGYNVTVEGGSGAGLYYAGDRVSIVVDQPREGYNTVWTMEGAEFVASGTYGAAFDMPDRDITVIISFVQKDETQPPETTPPETTPPETTPPETTEPPVTTPAETTEPFDYDKTPEGRRYMKMFIILGSVLAISLAALVLVLVLTGKKKADGAEFDDEVEK